MDFGRYITLLRLAAAMHERVVVKAERRGIERVAWIEEG
jgi:hypothetical protein